MSPLITSKSIHDLNHHHRERENLKSRDLQIFTKVYLCTCQLLNISSTNMMAVRIFDVERTLNMEDRLLIFEKNMQI